MKKLPSFLALGSLASLVIAHAAAPATTPPAATPAAPAAATAPATAAAAPATPPKADAKETAGTELKAVATLAAKDAKLTAPMVLKDGYISQPDNTGIAEGGKAVFEFTVPKDGDYEIWGVVSAPDDENNSFFVNVDVEPKEDPLMIWDITLTDGDKYEEHVVNWRGEGSAGSDQFDPKTFKLTAGAHKLYLLGREPAKLKSISIHPATNSAPAAPAAATAPAAAPAAPATPAAK
jgi:hypothetical protein